MTGTDTGTRPALRDEQQLRDLAAAGAAALHAELDAEGRVPAEGEASTEEAIRWVASLPAHVSVDELVIRPKAQAAQHKVHRTS